jgi:predicted XRE-type DNA-binding protein
MKVKMTKSSGNVFRDTGFPREEAEHLLVRADLKIQGQMLITSRRLKQKARQDSRRNAAPRERSPSG